MAGPCWSGQTSGRTRRRRRVPPRWQRRRQRRQQPRWSRHLRIAWSVRSASSATGQRRGRMTGLRRASCSARATSRSRLRGACSGPACRLPLGPPRAQASACGLPTPQGWDFGLGRPACHLTQAVASSTDAEGAHLGVQKAQSQKCRRSRPRACRSRPASAGRGTLQLPRPRPEVRSPKDA